MNNKQTEPRFTVDGNQYAPDLHKKPTENLETLMKALTEMLDDTSQENNCLLYTSPSPRDRSISRMPSSA